jgi:nitrite reductase (NADH) small subunit
MREMVKILEESDLPKEGQVMEAAGGRLCVARLQGQIVVLDNDCPHSGGPLGQGMIENGCVVCPYHGWAFDLKTGAASHDSSEKVRIFESEVRDGALMVRPPDYSA